MVEFLVNTQFLPLVLLGLFALTFLFQLFFYWIFFWRLARYANSNTDSATKGVSVVICARNEYHHLKENLRLMLEQDYPEYEVLVVNHSSDDDTKYFLTYLEEKYPHLTTISIEEDLNFFSGKKFPLSIGIKSAKYDLVLLTDADCRPASKDWIRLMQSAYTPKTEVVLGYGPYYHRKGFLNKLIRYDTAHIAIQYLSYALAGVPYMGVGRNLSYMKQLFYKHRGFIPHYSIRSGDDDLFINRVAGRSNTAVMVEPGSFTFSDPKETIGEWITQKRRHLSTGNLYKFRHKLLLGLYSFSLLSFYVLFILLLSLNWSLIPVLTLFTIRLVSQYVVFARCMKRLNERDLLIFLPFYEIVLLLVNAGTMTSNFFHKPTRWK
jgi:cellulose synthase/poly-beta-1,6-N-acetylglucosamine synthase-like glycosyltransferase